MEVKKMYKYFRLSDFIEEQEYLMAEHRSGWKFSSCNGLFSYKFEQCEPEEYIYQLDYNAEGKEEDIYIQFFLDCGWEYLMKYNSFYYFRKKKSEPDEEISIFSDDYSRMEMCKKVLRRNLFLMLFPLPLVCFFFSNIYLSYDGSFEYIFVQSVFLIIYLLILAVTIGSLIKLVKMSARLKHPLDFKD